MSLSIIVWETVGSIAMVDLMGILHGDMSPKFTKRQGLSGPHSLRRLFIGLVNAAFML